MIIFSDSLLIVSKYMSDGAPTPINDACNKKRVSSNDLNQFFETCLRVIFLLTESCVYLLYTVCILKVLMAYFSDSMHIRTVIQ